MQKKNINFAIEFLKSYTNSKDTLQSYRREVERLLHWSWLVCKKPLKELIAMTFVIIYIL